MAQEGFIKLHRKIQENVFYKNSEAVHLWLHLIFKASFEDNTFYYKNTKIELKRGQLITGRKKLSQETGINEYKIFRLLKMFENEQQIAQQTNRQYSIITILSYDSYNENAQQIAQRMHNGCTTDAQRMHTTKELKECKELKENIIKENFLDFYKLYPKKVAKDFAEKAYIKARKKVEHQVLIDGLKRYVEQIEKNKTERQYIKQPATWLNQGCWNDEYEEIKKEVKEVYNPYL